jgi:Protein of unknown function (DUF2384)
MPTKPAQAKAESSRSAAAKSGMKAAKKSAMKRYRHSKAKAAATLKKKIGLRRTSKTKTGPARPRGHKPARPPLPKAVPTGEEIAVKTTALTGPAAAAFDSIMTGLAEHLGSPEAARLWLVTPSPQFDTTPLDAILAGEAEAILAYLESQWGLGPVYA